jgi:CRISPR-associated protein Csb2
MLSAFAAGCDEEIAWARRTLSGEELVNQDRKRVAILSLIPVNERVVRCYTQTAAEWATVTPVVLPGYDDPRHYRRRMRTAIAALEQKELLGRLDDRIDGLLRKAIVQAGFSELLAEHAQIEWRKVGFWPGTDLAERYGVPDHLKRFPRLHVKIHWRDADGNRVQVPGPICLGGGRFYGVGLFAAV